MLWGDDGAVAAGALRAMTVAGAIVDGRGPRADGGGLESARSTVGNGSLGAVGGK